VAVRTSVERVVSDRRVKSGCCTKLRKASDGVLHACSVQAKWIVGLRLRPDRSSEPDDYFFDKLRVCNACRDKLELGEVLTDETFTHVSKKFLMWHKPPPRRRLTTLIFRHLALGYTSEG